MPRKICEWSEIEPGCGVYNTCTNGEEFHLYQGLDLWPYCHWCGGKIKVVELADEDHGTNRHPNVVVTTADGETKP